MPLHDWNTLTRWDGFHTLWITELLRWVKPRLPEGYRAYLGTTPRVYTSRYAGYLLGGVHLALIDLHSRPYAFSFADAIARALEFPQPAVPSPLAVAYRVGEPMPDRGSLLAVWRRPLAVGQPLPLLPLPLTVHTEVMLNLEETYMRSAADSYLV